MTRVYGDADPAVGFAAVGFVLGDTAGVVTGGLARTPGENVGNYGILRGTLAAENYAILYLPNILRITPAPLLVTPDAVGRIFADSDPALTFATAELKLADTAG